MHNVQACSTLYNTDVSAPAPSAALPQKHTKLNITCQANRQYCKPGNPSNKQGRQHCSIKMHLRIERCRHQAFSGTGNLPTSRSQVLHALVTRPRLCVCRTSEADAPAQLALNAHNQDPPHSTSTPSQEELHLQQKAAAQQPSKQPLHVVVSDALENISITIVGDDTALSWAVCQALSKKIGWFPVSTSKVLTGMHKVADVEELIATKGHDVLGRWLSCVIHLTM